MNKNRLKMCAVLGAASLFACTTRGDNPVVPEVNAGCQVKKEIKLSVNDTTTLSHAEADCFMLDGTGSYLLAGLDTRAINASKKAKEPRRMSDVTYTIQDKTSTGTTPLLVSPANKPTQEEKRPDFVVVPASIETNLAQDVIYRNSAWVEGETFPVKRPHSSEIVQAKVIKIYDGKFVLAKVEGDSHKDMDSYIKHMDIAMEKYMVPKGIPQIRRIFGVGDPVTSKEGGQLLILLSAWDVTKSSGNAFAYIRKDKELSLRLDININISGAHKEGYGVYDHPSYRLKILSHELMHAYQGLYGYVKGYPMNGELYSTLWAAEGTANFIGLEHLRDYLGIGLMSNWDWDRVDAKTYTYTLEAREGTGHFTKGYFPASSFMRSEQVRMIRSGLDAETALKEITLGSLEGFSGREYNFGGLIERASAYTKTNWVPEDRLLYWAITQAADDKTRNPELQNYTFKDVSSKSPNAGWKSPIEGVLKNGTSEKHVFPYPFGSPFAVKITNTEKGVYTATANSPETKWMLVRIK